MFRSPFGRFSSGSLRGLVTLAIESTCDESACAVIRDKQVLSHCVASQWHLLQEFNGVNPSFAAREHEKQLPIVIQQAIQESKLSFSQLDFVSVAAGPGLAVCLKSGLNHAKSICREYNKPLVAVNHLEAHVLVAGMGSETLTYPFLSLLVSGGNTLFLLVRGVGNYEILGATVDDAVGEAFDKVSVLLGLKRKEKESFGACLERHAESGNDLDMFAVPYLQWSEEHKHSEKTNFSFSGLKSSVRRKVVSRRKELGLDPSQPLDHQEICDFAACFQGTAVRHLELQLRRALDKLLLRNIQIPSQLVLCGGAASNSVIRENIEKLCSSRNLEFVCPPSSLCTDNAIMIGWTGMLKYKLGHVDSLDIDYRDQWPLE